MVELLSQNQRIKNSMFGWATTRGTLLPAGLYDLASVQTGINGCEAARGCESLDSIINLEGLSFTSASRPGKVDGVVFSSLLKVTASDLCCQPPSVHMQGFSPEEHQRQSAQLAVTRQIFLGIKSVLE
ncbi:hypothetical protein RRG08_039975 [Elysia crispata]|uniref:Uncharacterized protein n=1 Tax=Elysia crispata TaxID=231223 RepID=A0AAE0Z7S3_9GAST|nr:hypothetical protein RRG08_039975 [Elysia crispata]